MDRCSRYVPRASSEGFPACTASVHFYLSNNEPRSELEKSGTELSVTKLKSLLLTAHVGVVDDRFAPRAAALVLVGADPELVGCVGFQVVDDGVAGGAGLVDPLPVPLSVADGVKAA